MWRIKRIPNFHVIFLYLTSVHMLSLHYNRHTSSYVIAQSTQDTIENDSSTPTLDLDQKSPEEIKHIKREYLNVVEERFFNLKGRPTEPVPDKAFVPRAMLEEYIKMRDSVREFIPDDRDFYGKINIDSSVETHEDFWSAVYNKYGSYDIKVDMGQSNPSDETGYRYKGEASHIAHIPASKYSSLNTCSFVEISRLGEESNLKFLKFSPQKQIRKVYPKDLSQYYPHMLEVYRVRSNSNRCI